MSNRKRNIIVTLISSVVLAGTIFVLVISYVRSMKDKESKDEKNYSEVAVVVNHWNDTHHANYMLCAVNGRTEFSTGSDTSRGWFETDMSIEDIIATNAEDYIGTRLVFFDEIFILEEPVEVHTFYSDNNYYYFYRSDEYKCYIMGNLCARWDGDSLHDANIRFPFPEPMVIWDNISDYEDIQYVFEHHDFENLKEFYSRISEEYYTIDEENQVITVKAYGNTNNLSWEGGYCYEIIIDCENRTITGPSRHNGTLTVK